ncbi:uncharacterized protein EAE97_006544 [Botrytis byssoidea]|uniref:Zn(2)-C6 fungal-type domain-containing protein n=1 Tax=Botrytis byssoidea TaxID=139641 RepID=A0A9P5IHW7_9HELO|nr:uncharacterized protein EAE97_006544 [Botrytis byssoidea]KAF7941707.1 hypothetical protein EAE97_006544 [Botrytis byssoidea]
MSDNIISKRKRSNTTGRSKYGCLTCRAKKVKCDERLPSCGRCERLKLDCQQPCSRILPSVRERRRGAGPIKSRDSDWSPQSLSPALQVSEEQPQGSEALLNHYLSGYDHGLAAASASSFSVGHPEGVSQNQAPIVEAGADMLLDPVAEWLLPDPQSLNVYTRTNYSPLSFEPLAIADILSTQERSLENGMSLNNDEELALEHYRTAFSLSQTTRHSQWSTPTLLLIHSLKHSEMLLHLILAVSLYDMPSNPESVNRLRQTGHKHYEKGTEQLMQALQCENPADHLAILAAFYCIHMYMSRSNGTIISKLDRLSLIAIEHLTKHNLIVTHAQSSLTKQSSTKSGAERSLIARIIMWLLKMDAQGSFLGCKPNLANHFQAHPDQLLAIQAESRLALQLNWGAEYPISQSIRDIESLPVDMMSDMLILCCKISEFSHKTPCTEADVMQEILQKEFAALEIRFGAVFYYGSSDMTLQPAMKLNCANSATMFYALQICFARCRSSPFGAESTTEIKTALSQLLRFAMYISPAGSQQPVYEFQWSLFTAAIETNDMIHQEWLQGRITDHRLRKSLQGISTFKRNNLGVISFSKVKEVILAM